MHDSLRKFRLIGFALLIFALPTMACAVEPGSDSGRTIMVPALSFNGSGGRASTGSSTASRNAMLPSIPTMGIGHSAGGANRLTDDMMHRFMATVKELRAEGQNVQGKGGLEAMMSLNASMQKTMHAHGFTADTWSSTLALVLTAVGSLEIKKEFSTPSLDAQFAASRKDIEEAKDYPPALKQQMLQQLEQQKKIMEAARHQVDPNEAIVRPYLSRLQGGTQSQ